MFNSLAPGRFQFNFRYVIFKLNLVNGGWGLSDEIALEWLPLDFTNDKSTLVQVMAWCRQATSHYLNQCWPRSMSPNGVTRPQWVNSLWLSATWSVSSLFLVMACCLTAPSRYLNQCWLLISEILLQSHKSNFIVSAQAAILYKKFANYTFDTTATSPAANELISLIQEFKVSSIS